MEKLKRRLSMRWGIVVPLILCLTVLLGEVARGAPIADPDFTVPILNPADLQKYVSPLPNAYLLQIAPDTATYPGEDYYKVDMGQFNHDMQLLLAPAAVASYPAAVAGKLPPTPTWGYSLVPPAGATPGTYSFPGPTFVNTQGKPSRVTWTNSLPAQHVVSLDPTLVCGPPNTGGTVNGPPSPFVNNGPYCAPGNRTVPHAHGAHVWDDSDGDPLAWFSSNFAVTGETWKPNTQHGPVGTYRYINDQEAGSLWYHDHAMGLTHLNVYAGLAGFFLITDANEKGMQAYTPGVSAPILPSYTAAGPYEIPMAIQDRKLYPDGTLAAPNNPVLDATATIGPNVPCDTTVGAFAPYACLPIVPPATAPANAILSPTILCDPAAVVNAYMCPAAQFSKDANGNLVPYNAAMAPPGLPGPFTAPSITPEFFGNVSVVNGIAWPVNSTEQRKYRLRLLNGCDSRTYFLKFEPSVPNPAIAPIPVWQIGTDQAFLDKPVDRTGQFIILMPGERMDFIVDFTGVPVGTRVLMNNYGPTATVNGLPPSPTNPLLDIPYDGVLPVAGQPINPILPDVMAFDIVAINPAIPDATITLNTALRAVPAFTGFPNLVPTAGAPGSTGVAPRKLTLIERGGTNGRFTLTIDGRDFMDPNSPITDLPKLNDIEEWEIINLTPDAHPIHVHLVAFQIVNRQEISVDPASPIGIYDPNPALPPFTRWPMMPFPGLPTVINALHNPLAAPDYPPLLPVTASVPTPPDPGEVGWKDTIQTLPGTVTRIRAKFDIPGLYVWHCHILSHEENDMMRPLIVTTPAKTVTATLTRNGVALGSSELAAQAAPITIKAQALTGLAGPAILTPQQTNGFEYQFSITDPSNVTTVVQPFIAWMYPMLDNYLWTPPKNAPGTYTIRVDAREASATAAGASQAFTTTTYTLVGPAIAGVTSTTAAGAYKGGTSVNISLLFNQMVTSTAGLSLTLNSGATVTTGPITTPTASVSVPYVVGATDNTPVGLPLDIASITGSISDAANNAVTALTVPAGANLSNAVQILIDNTLPTIALTAPATTVSFTNSASQTVAGTVTDPVGIQSFTVNGTAVTLTAGAFSTSVALTANSANTITLVAIDMAGNQATTTLTVTQDNTLPTVTLTAPTAQYVNNVNQTVTGTATDSSGILSITVNGAAVTPSTGGAFTAQVTLTAGVANIITVVVTDNAGNQTTVTRTVNHSAILPIVVFTSPPPFVNNVNQTVAGTATSPIGIQSVTVNGTAVTVGAGGAFSTPITLTANTANTIVVVAVDVAGNQNTFNLIVTHDTTLPVTTATPPPGTYSGSVSVELAANKPGAIIYYSTNGIAPTTASTRFVIGQPIVLSSATTATIKLMYFAVDQAGNAEAVKTGTYTLHTADLTAKIAINNGKAYTNTPNVTLAMSASDKLGVAAYAISVDGGLTYQPTVAITPAVITFSKKVAITLPSGEGLKSVFVKFTDGVGVVYAPVTAKITLDMTPPSTTVTPASGNYPGGTMKVALAANERATIYYTINGTTPTTKSSIYKSLFTITGTNITVTVKYFAVDMAGNTEAVKTATYVFGHLADLTATFSINNGKKYTKSRDVLLSFTAADPVSGGVASMSFSNDGVNFTPVTPYAPATAMPWTLSAGNGLKTVYIRFVDKFAPPNTYTYTAQIFLAEGIQDASGDINGDGKCDIADALRALQASSGITTLNIAEQARGDVAPIVNGVPQPDGKIDGGDALVITRKVLGLATF